MTTAEALQKSIEHWERLADSEPGEEMGSDNCALCRMFIDNGCAGCPVSEKTGKSSCEDTPYRNADLAEIEYGYNSEEFRAAAHEELKFLLSLKA